MITKIYILTLILIFIKSVVNEDCRNSITESHQSTWSNFNAKEYGNSYDFGNFTACQHLSPVKYCFIQYFNDFVKPIPVLPTKAYYRREWNNTQISFFGAVCMPNDCGTDDVREAMRSEFDEKNLSFGGIYCKNIEEPWTIFGVYSVTWWSFERFIIFALVLTIAILFATSNFKQCHPTTIFKDLFAKHNENTSTAYLSGVKALSTLIIVIFHAWYYRSIFPFENGKYLDEFTNGLFYRILMVSNLVMEFFFIVGGILAYKGLSKGFKEKNKLKWILKYYIKRSLRILPVAAFILALTASSVSDRFAPFSFSDDIEKSRKYWWMTLTYNYLDPKYRFSTFFWFIAVYMQFIFAAPFIFWFSNIKQFEKVSSAFILAFATVTRYLHTSNGFYEKALTSLSDNFDFLSEVEAMYNAAQHRVLPFLGGMIVGKFIEEKFANIKQVFVGAFVALCVSFPVVLSTMPYSLGRIVSVADTFFLLNVILLFYVLHQSSGSFKSFLSHSCWLPISKAGLSIYLVVSYHQHGNHKRLLTPQNIQNEFQFLFEFLKDVVQTFIPVLAVYAFVEEPFSRLGDILAGKI